MKIRNGNFNTDRHHLKKEKKYVEKNNRVLKCQKMRYNDFFIFSLEMALTIECIGWVISS